MLLTLAQRRILSWAALLVAVLLLLWLLAPVLTPFVLGAILAYALHPAVAALAARKVPRAAAVLLVVVLAAWLMFALLLLVVPVFVKQIPQLKDQVPLLLDRLNAALTPWLAQLGINVQLDIASLKAMAAKSLDGNAEEWVATVLNSMRIGGSVALTIVGNLVLVPVVLFYLLMDWPHLVTRALALVPLRLRDAVDGFLSECDAVLGQYLRGQLLVMLVLAVYYWMALALAGFDMAMPVGVFTGLAVFIPYLGFGLGLTLALLAALLQFPGWYGVAMVALIYGIGQAGESFFLTPRLVGERIGLNPLAVIFALMAFGQLFGFVGVLAALPLAAVTLVAVRRLHALYVHSDMYRA